MEDIIEQLQHYDRENDTMKTVINEMAVQLIIDYLENSKTEEQGKRIYEIDYGKFEIIVFIDWDDNGCSVENIRITGKYWSWEAEDADNDLEEYFVNL